MSRIRTPLDDADHWFLLAIAFQDDELKVSLVEGAPENAVILGESVEGLRKVEYTDESRIYLVRFRRIVAWQVIDESFTQWDEYEIRDDKCFIQRISRSKYLDYVESNHGWFETTLGPAVQYRVWTQSDVVDVVCCEPPQIDEWSEQIDSS